MRHRTPAALLATLLTLTTAADPLAAQTTGPAPAKEEVVELSPFVVTSEQDHGYQATNTLAGSRMNTSLRDTAASISILTEEFLQDIAALDLTEAIAFGNNVELELPDGNPRFEFFNTFLVRGQAATVARNYFRWKVPTNNFNIERIEEARGPNAILFGVASAGGLISASTKQAYTNRNSRKAQIIYGSYDLRNATVDINQMAFNGKFGVRFNGLVSKTQGYQHYVFNEDNRGHLAVKWDVARNTIVRAEYEKGDTHRNTADNQEVGDNVMRWINAGRTVKVVTGNDNTLGITRNGAGGNLGVTVLEDGPSVVSYLDMRQMGISQAASAALVTDPTLIDNVNYQVNIGGPSQYQDSSFETYTASIEHKLGKSTFLNLAFNHQDYDFSAWQAMRATGLFGDPNKFLKDGVTPNPHAGQLYFETNPWVNRRRHEELDNLRFMASTEVNLGKWGEYRFAALAEREESRWAKDNFNEIWVNSATGLPAFNATPSNSANFVRRRHYITERDYSTYFASYANPEVLGLRQGVPNPATPGQTLHSALFRASGSDFDDPQEQDSFLLAAQAYYFKRKLVFAGGYRADTLHVHEGMRNVVDPLTREFIVDNVNNPRDNRTIDGTTRTYGVVYHVLPWLSLRYNNSNSFELPPAIRIVPGPDTNGHFIGSVLAASPKGEGEDYGIDLNLLDGRLFLRATRFASNRVRAVRNAGPNGIGYNGTLTGPVVLSNLVMDALVNSDQISAAERELHRVDSGGATFDVASVGYELSLTANPTKNWRLQANFSITDSAEDNIAPEVQAWAAAEFPYFRTGHDTSVLTSAGKSIEQTIQEWEAANASILAVEGVSAIGARRNKFSVATRYTFDRGPIKGLYVGGTCRHQSKMVIGNNTITNTLVYGNSFTRADAFIGYRFAKIGKLRFLKSASLQLNVLNVLDDHNPLITRVSDANAAVLLVDRLVPQEPRAWRLTASFAF